jgi:hypothetical protein
VSLEAFYEMSRANFIDNSIILGVEMCLLVDLQDTFSQDAVANLKDDEIEDMTIELPEIARHRQTANEALITLRAGRKACNAYKGGVQYRPTLTPERRKVRKPRSFGAAPTPVALDEDDHPSSASDSEASPPTAKTTPEGPPPFSPGQPQKAWAQMPESDACKINAESRTMNYQLKVL